MDKAILIKKIKGWLHFRIYRLNLHFELILYKRWKWRKYFVRNANVLEIGPGGGVWTIELLLRGNKVTSVDVNLPSLNRLKKKVEIFPLRNKQIKIIHCHICDFKPDGEYDQIILFEVLEHIKNDRLVLEVLTKALKPNGTLLISTPSHNFIPIKGESISEEEDGGHVRKGYSFSDYDELLSGNGLKIIKQESCAGFFTRKALSFDRLASKKVKVEWLIYPLRLLLRPITYLDFLCPAHPRFVNFAIAQKMSDVSGSGTG